MQLYTPTERVHAARITAKTPMTEAHGGGWEITLEGGVQVYENYADFQHAKIGDYHIRPLGNEFNPLPRSYHLPAIAFENAFRKALPALADNRVPAERIDALVASLTVQCQRFPGTTSTTAIAALPNGFVVAQGFEGCIDPKMFDAALGVKYATEDVLAKARAKLWEMEGYHLMRMREMAAHDGQG
jgi:hypothetical protein